MDVFMDSDELRSVIAGALSKRFPKMRVLSIDVRASEDEDGGDTIDVDVVFEAKNERDFDPAKVPACISEIVVALSEKDVPFPVLSFIAKSDLGKRKSEAA
jgi:hypothetical protein